MRLKFLQLMTYGVWAGRGKAVALILAFFLVPPVAVAQERVTVLALGDSLTAGYGLRREEGFVNQLGAWLAANGQGATLINAGVSGDTTAGGLARVDWSLTPEVDAMIVTLGGNDILRGIDPATTRANLTGILQAAKAREVPVLLIGLFASANYGADFKAAFERIHPELAAEFGTLYEPNFFQALAGADGSAASYLEWMQRDGIHPNADGVARIVKRIGPRVIELIAQAG